ncbi:MAG: tetratricopeptide repeat protein [Deltaproteobacteria bacterium]|nr:tetratricopeptide repeat protein [Deltaproteobacteria bacterium]
MERAKRRARHATILGSALLLAIAVAVLGCGGAAAAPLAGAGMLLGFATACAFALGDTLSFPALRRPGRSGLLVSGLLALAGVAALHAFYTHAAILRLAIIVGAAGVYATTLVASASRAASERLRTGLVLLGAAAAVLALIHIEPMTAGIPGALTGHPGDAPHTGGPFINPNHLAALLASILPVALAGVLFLGKQPASRIGALLQAAGVAVCLAGLLATGSRGGLLAAIAGLGSLALCVSLAKGKDAGRWRKRGRAAALALTLLGGLSLGHAEVLSRFKPPEGTSESSMGFRISIWKSTVDAIGSGGAAGWGLGTFPWVYPAHRGVDVPYRVEHAHNDWVEGSLEMGWAFPLLALGAAVTFARQAIVTSRTRNDRVAVASAAAGLSGLVALGAHALVDSPLQMAPLLWLWGLYAGLITASAGMGRRGSVPALRPRGMAPAMGAAACLLVTVSFSIFTLRDARAAAAIAEAEASLSALAPERAVELGRRATALDPGSAGAHGFLGRMILESRQSGQGGHLALREAGAAFASAVKLNPRDASSYLALAFVAEARGERPVASAALDDAVRLDPRAGAAREARARFRLAEGLRAEALVDLEASVAADARGLSRVLPLLWEVTADPILARSVTPSSPPALIYLGEFLDTKGRAEAADAAFAEAAALDPAMAEPLAARARIALAGGRHAAALVLAREAVGRDARHVPAMRVLAGALMASGKPAAAGEAYESILALRPGDLGAARGLAEVATQRGRPEDAISAWARVSEAAPGNAEARVELARAHRRAGNWNQAVETCRGLSAARPGNRACHDLLIDLYLERGLTSSARAILEDRTAGEGSQEASGGGES